MIKNDPHVRRSGPEHALRHLASMARTLDMPVLYQRFDVDLILTIHTYIKFIDTDQIYIG